MLDKSVPYAEIWMHRPRESVVTEVELPSGYQFSYYQAGDEEAWAVIETTVLEFETIEAGLDYFNQSFAPFPDELGRRMLFVNNEKGEKIATATAWWKIAEDGKRYPLVHWVAVKPEYQGKGIAKALISRVLQQLQVLETTTPIYLHTKTWSHIAIRLYQQFGFTFSRNNLDGTLNPDYEKVLKVMTEMTS